MPIVNAEKSMSITPSGATSNAARGIAGMAQELIASEILKIAGQIRVLQRGGADILNLTVGDFNSSEFPIPTALADGVRTALAQGHTNYPPSNGVPELREAVKEMFRDRLGLEIPLDSVLIAGGARPVIAGTYFTLLNPGDRVVYPLPSWNNNHYCTLVRAERVEVPTGPEHGFFPQVKDLAPHLPTARLLCINTPLNPTGTVMDPNELEALCKAIIDENRKRASAGRVPLYLMFDQIYWMLTFGAAVHATPIGLVPEMAPYTIFVDGISKAFAATGLRVGWAVGPADVIERMSAILTHIGAWAPRPEQIAAAALLRDASAFETYRAFLIREVGARLATLAEGISSLRRDGHDVEAIAPQGAIYLSLRIGIAGRTTPDGQVLRTDEDIRAYLLREAQVALVPFQAFGLTQDSGWFRASVGAISKADAGKVVDRLKSALSRLR